jgi:uncharacterized protein (TIGR03084 family)
VAEPQDVVSALIAEGLDLDRLVAGLDESQWALPTPAEGWSVAHQIAHLAMVFQMATMSTTAPAAFTDFLGGIGPDFNGAVQQGLLPFLADGPEKLLSRWRELRSSAERGLAALEPGTVVPWLVRPIPAAVLAAAGTMELFAHGQDVADALGVRRQYTDRLRHVAGFAVLTWDFGYQARGLTPPETEFGYDLTSPSGELWQFGPAEAEQRISGPAVDYCLLYTRRRHREDLAVVATGADADQWLNLAQAYRGPAGPGRTPGQFDALG